MPPESAKVVALRRLLDERFPAVRRRESRTISTGVPNLDRLLAGGLRTGTITEFVSAVPSAGNQSTLGSLLMATRVAQQRVALIDAAASFDVGGFDDDALAHVVWVRCESLHDAWRAADLAVRDPNYAVIYLDVRGWPERTLLRTRDSVWLRLQRGAEQAETAMAVQTTTPLVPNAARRVVFATPWSGDVLTCPRTTLLGTIEGQLQRVRLREGIA
jgi:hypothetical protein